MNIFHRDFEKINEEKKKQEEEIRDIQKLRESNLGAKDIAAIFLAMIEVIAPIALGIVIIYFVVIEFLTKVWFKY